jgi:acetyltransferase-like isoleucine patch superfamily enzyme
MAESSHSLLKTETNRVDEFIESSRSYAIAAWLVVPVVTAIFEEIWTFYVSSLIGSAMLSYILSSLLLFGLLIITTDVAFKFLVPRYRRTRMVSVAILWVVLFLIFDVLYRYYLLAVPLDIVVGDYFLFSGGLRGLVLLVMCFGPIIFVRTHIGDPNLFEMPLGKMATIGLLPSSLKISYYRRKGAEIGEGVKIGPLSILDCKKIVIGDYAEIGMANMIRAKEFTLGRYSKLGMLVIIDTNKVVIGEEVTIQEQVYIGGLKTDKSTIEIGDLSMIFAQSVINPTHPIKIGKRVGIGGSNFLFTHGTWQPILDGFPVAFGPITIEDGVWFPWRVFVLPNVHIGKEATIGAGSVINRDIPARCLAAGVPAKVLRKEGEYIRKYTDKEKRDILKEVLFELVGYLRIEDWQVTDPILEESYATTTFRTPRGPSSEQDNQVILLFEDRADLWDMTRLPSFVITLFAISSDRANHLEQSGSWWFDLANSTWGGTRTNVSLVIHSWLSRYGHWLKYSS